MPSPSRSVVALSVLALLFCCGKGKPSAEYAQALILHDRLYTEALDDAYVDPRMAEVETLLTAVPPRSRDSKDAQALRVKIQTNRARITDENEDRRRKIAEAVRRPVAMPDAPTTPTPSAPESPTPEVDAGPPQPTLGMSLPEFFRQFSGCFVPARTIELPGKGPHDTYELKDLPSCRDRYPLYADVLLVFEDAKVLGRVPKASLVIEHRQADGGRLPGTEKTESATPETAPSMADAGG